MKNLNKIATGIALTLSMGLAATAYAQPGQMHGNMGGGHQGMQSGDHGIQGAQGGHDMQGAMGGQRQGGMKHGDQDRQTMQQLMTPEEKTAMQEKMRTAATPEARQKMAVANRAEMQKRAQEKGITLPEHRGSHGRMGNATTGPEATTQSQ